MEHLQRQTGDPSSRKLSAWKCQSLSVTTQVKSATMMETLRYLGGCAPPFDSGDALEDSSVTPETSWKTKSEFS